MPAARPKAELQSQKKAKVRKELVAFDWEERKATWRGLLGQIHSTVGRLYMSTG